MIKGIIFDLDGVIISTDEYHYQAWKAIADKEGIYFDREINNRLRGVSRMASLDIILEKSNKQYSEEAKQALADEKQALYRKCWRQCIQNIKQNIGKTRNCKLVCMASYRRRSVFPFYRQV